MATILIVLGVYGVAAFVVVNVERALAAREEAAMRRRIAASRLLWSAGTTSGIRRDRRAGAVEPRV